MRRERPRLVSECHSLPEAERHRHTVISAISKKVAEIQNGACGWCGGWRVRAGGGGGVGRRGARRGWGGAEVWRGVLRGARAAGLGEPRIRDLNDLINRLFKEKERWERRIVELGGRDFAREGSDALSKSGVALPGGGGYKYFGAAKDLPGVRELFAEYEAEHKSKQRWEAHRRLSPDYWGFRDEADPRIRDEEERIEREVREDLVREFERDHGRPTDSGLGAIGAYEPPPEEADRAQHAAALEEGQKSLREALERKRAQLLRKSQKSAGEGGGGEGGGGEGGVGEGGGGGDAAAAAATEEEAPPA
jgi:Isy1-like splicing family